MSERKLPFPGPLQDAAEHLWQQSYQLRRLRGNFRRFARVVGSKPHGVNGEFAQWIRQMFTHTLSLAVRRLIDDDRRVVSLKRLMRQVRARYKEFSREKWMSAWMDGASAPANIDDFPGWKSQVLLEHHQKELESRATAYFEKFAAQGMCSIDPNLVVADEEALDEDCSRIKEMVNNYIAHDSKLKGQELPTYGDLDAAVDLIIKLIEKYYSLFHQTIPADFEDLDSWKNEPGFPFPEEE